MSRNSVKLDKLLENTDVLIWWGHVRHKDVPDEWADKIVKRINEGMGFIALHSTHYSKIFKSLMGTQCNLQWRISHDHERLWNIAPNHPVTVDRAHLGDVGVGQDSVPVGADTVEKRHVAGQGH